MLVSVTFHKSQLTGQKEVASVCTKGSLDLILGDISWQEVLLSLPRETAESPSLEEFRRYIAVVLRDMV